MSNAYAQAENEKPTSGDMYGVFATDAVRMRWYISLRLVS